MVTRQKNALLARYDIILIEHEFCHSIGWAIAPRRVMARLIWMATITLVPTSVHRQRLRPPAVVNSIPILNSSCLISSPSIELLCGELATLGKDQRQLGRLLAADPASPATAAHRQWRTEKTRLQVCG